MNNIENNSVVKLGVIFVSLIVFFSVFYLLTGLVAESVPSNVEFERVPMQNENIMVGTILSRNVDDYYVIAALREDMSFGRYKELLDDALDAEKISKYYVVDLGDPFNNKFVGDERSLNVERASDFLFNDTTLIRIVDGQVVNYEVGSLDIVKYLSSK